MGAPVSTPSSNGAQPTAAAERRVGRRDLPGSVPSASQQDLVLEPEPRSWRRIILIAAGAVLLIAIRGLAAQRLLAPPAAPPTPTAQIASVQRTAVASTLSATGSVVASRQANLSFRTSGQVASIDVNVGDHVTAGQTLATLSSGTQQMKLTQAESQLASAQLKLQQSTEPATTEEVAAAQAAYDAAAAKLAELQAGPTAADVQTAQAALAQAQANVEEATLRLQTLEAGGTVVDQASAQAAVESAQEVEH